MRGASASGERADPGHPSHVQRGCRGARAWQTVSAAACPVRVKLSCKNPSRTRRPARGGGPGRGPPFSMCRVASGRLTNPNTARLCLKPETTAQAKGRPEPRAGRARRGVGGGRGGCRPFYKDSPCRCSARVEPRGGRGRGCRRVSKSSVGGCGQPKREQLHHRQRVSQAGPRRELWPVAAASWLVFGRHPPRRLPGARPLGVGPAAACRELLPDVRTAVPGRSCVTPCSRFPRRARTWP